MPTALVYLPEDADDDSFDGNPSARVGLLCAGSGQICTDAIDFSRASLSMPDIMMNTEVAARRASIQRVAAFLLRALYAAYDLTSTSTDL